MKAINHKFLDQAIQNLKNHNVEVNIDKSVNFIRIDNTSKLMIDGYYDHENKKLCVATGGQSDQGWFETFLHEYCHFLLDSSGASDPKSAMANRKLDDWSSGLTTADLNERYEWARLVREDETACEKKVIQIVKKNKLDLDQERYIKGANAYLFYFNILPEIGWFDDNAPPSAMPSILRIMPSRFLRSYDNTPAKYRELVYRFCLKKKIRKINND